MRYLPTPGLSKAILIGAGDFDSLPELPAVRHNLTDLREALTNKVTGILPPDRCTIVRNPGSTATFMTELRKAAREVEDFFLVYYAGHGVRDPIDNDRLYLAVRETDGEEPDGNAVTFESVRKVIELSKAHTRVLILDCCYSGLAAGVMSGAALDVQEVAVDGTAVLTSAPKNKRSLSPPGERHTAFTGELITLLRNGSRVPGEQLTVDTAFRSLKATLNARNLPLPKLKTTETSGDILLRRPPPTPPTPPPTPAPRPVLIEPEPIVPILAPVPPPAPARPRVPARPGIVKTTMKDLGWFTLWFGLAVGVALLIGGFGTEIAIGQGTGTGVVGIVFTVVCGTCAAMRVRHLRRHVRSSPRLGELSPLLAKARTPLSIFGLVVFAISILGDLAPTTTGTTVASSAVTNVTMTTLLVEGTIACAYKVLKSIVEQRRQGTSPALP